MIKIENLYKSYKSLSVLNDISFTIKKGDIYGIIGQSGAGKSTLLRCINGLEDYDSGKILIDNKLVRPNDKKAIKVLRKDIGMIFQNFNLLERLNVYDNVALPLKFWGMKTNDSNAKKRITELLDLVGLADKLHSKPRELSGGQKQRVAIARAIVLNPKILLCDEATSALDPEITSGILSLILKINKELGITVVVVTHQMEVVKQVCTNVAFLSKGKVLSIGTPQELFIKPQYREIEDFLHQDSKVLPKTGVNIQLYFFTDGAREPIVTEMARTLDRNFSIHWAKIEDFRDESYGSLVLNAQKEDVKKVCDFLESRNVSYKVLN